MLEIRNEVKYGDDLDCRLKCWGQKSPAQRNNSGQRPLFSMLFKDLNDSEKGVAICIVESKLVSDDIKFFDYANKEERLVKITVGSKVESEDKMSEKDERVKVALRIAKEKLEQIDHFVEIAGSSSRNAFIEEAIEFYGGYIVSNKNRYLPIVVSSSLESIVKLTEDRISRLLFKNTVELAMMLNVVAHNFDIDEDTMKKLRKQCISEVKGTLGKINFEEIYKYQKD